MITKIVEMHPVKTSTTNSFIKGRLRSFGFAWAGIRKFFATEKNAQVHLAAAVAVISLSVLLRVNRMEVIALVFAIAIVWITEMLNTAVERAMDFVSLEQSPYIKVIKDIAAGAVLVSSVAALVVGAIIFIPKILAL